VFNRMIICESKKFIAVFYLVVYFLYWHDNLLYFCRSLPISDKVASVTEKIAQSKNSRG